MRPGTFLTLAVLTLTCQSQAASAAATPSADRPPAPVDCTDFPPQETSAYILPWQVGETYKVARSTSHWTPRNHGVGLYAMDIFMPIGAKIVAARAGTVVALYEEFRDENGDIREDLRENYLFVRHDDGTIGRYFHLKHQGVLVELGAQVAQGAVVALSGKTGTIIPHLHFDVQGCGPNRHPDINKYPCGQTVPVTFRNTSANACGVIGGASYEALPFKENTAASLAMAERAEIVKTVTDYVTGWHSGNSERVRRALHPQLEKATVEVDAGGITHVTRTGALMLIEQTQSALGAHCTRIGGVRMPCDGAPEARPEIAIIDVSGLAASAKVLVAGEPELLHLAKVNGRWLIVDILRRRS